MQRAMERRGLHGLSRQAYNLSLYFARSQRVVLQIPTFTPLAPFPAFVHPLRGFFQLLSSSLAFGPRFTIYLRPMSSSPASQRLHTHVTSRSSVGDVRRFSYLCPLAREAYQVTTPDSVTACPGPA